MQQPITAPNDQIKSPQAHGALLDSLDIKQVETFMHHTVALKQHKQVFDGLRQLLETRGAAGIPLAIQQLRMASSSWDADVDALALPIQNTIKHIQSCSFARMAEIEEQFGTLYEIHETPNWLPAVHMHGGATPLAPPLSQYAPSYMNMFHPVGAVSAIPAHISDSHGIGGTATVKKTAAAKKKTPAKKTASAAVKSENGDGDDNRSGGILYRDDDDNATATVKGEEEADANIDEFSMALLDEMQIDDGEGEEDGHTVGEE